MAREYFNVYHSYLKAMEPLNYAERGRLFTACLEYSMTGEVPELGGNERFIFPSWQSQIDRERENYENKCKIQSDNAKKRWHANDATACGGIIGNANDAKDKEEDKEESKDKDQNKNIVRAPGKKDIDSFFESVWALYPNKKGKGQISDATKRKLFAIGYDVLKRCVDRYTKGKPDWQKFQNGSTFFNSGYVDYLDENFDSSSIEPKNGDKNEAGQTYYNGKWVN